MPRVLIAQCKQEVSTFNPVASHYDDFEVTFAETILAECRGGREEIGGALSVFDARSDVQIVPTVSFQAITSGGTLAASGFSRIADTFLGGIKAAKHVDGVYFSLHGAMSAENEEDPEGYLLLEARRILGEQSLYRRSRTWLQQSGYYKQ